MDFIEEVLGDSVENQGTQTQDRLIGREPYICPNRYQYSPKWYSGLWYHLPVLQRN